MNRFVQILALIIASCCSAGIAFADPIEGLWKTKPDDNGNYGHVEVSPCGASFCGTLIKAFDGTGAEIRSSNIGKKLIWDMRPKGNGAYGDGKVFSPDRGKTYSSKLKLSGNGLQVSGCVLGICRDGGTWTRVK